jgi:hypothetical protein
MPKRTRPQDACAREDLEAMLAEVNETEAKAKTK